MRKPTLILAIACIDFLRGLVLIISGVATYTTGLSLFLYVASPRTVGLFLFGLGLLTFAGYYFRTIYLLLPQIFVWIFSSLSAIYNITVGTYSNGYSPPEYPHLFIYHDQVYVPILTIFYIYTLIKINRWSNHRQ